MNEYGVALEKKQQKSSQIIELLFVSRSPRGSVD